MSDNSKFWLAANAILGVVLVSVIFISANYWKDHNKKTVDLIGSGVNPVAVMCAMQDDYGIMPVCLVLAAKDKK